jgi:NADH-quinone oxidoreductase subunit C
MTEDLQKNVAWQKLQAFAPEVVEEGQVFRRETTIYLKPDNLLRAMEFLRDDQDLSFKYLSDVTAVDYYPNEPRFSTVYHLYSIERGERLRIKVRLPGDNPRVASMTALWKGAWAFEREAFDLFGIIFEGHPDLRRFLLPENWEGYPLRKDYPTEGYR